MSQNYLEIGHWDETLKIYVLATNICAHGAVSKGRETSGEVSFTPMHRLWTVWLGMPIKYCYTSESLHMIKTKVDPVLNTCVCPEPTCRRAFGFVLHQRQRSCRPHQGRRPRPTRKLLRRCRRKSWRTLWRRLCGRSWRRLYGRRCGRMPWRLWWRCKRPWRKFLAATGGARVAVRWAMDGCDKKTVESFVSVYLFGLSIPPNSWSCISSRPCHWCQPPARILNPPSYAHGQSTHGRPGTDVPLVHFTLYVIAETLQNAIIYLFLAGRY